jgi:cell division protein FtsI (penicillin-binding protein 3)
MNLQERKRLAWVFLGLFGLFSLLAIQFYRLQVIEHEKWQKLGCSQHFTVVEEPARRGLFYPNESLLPAGQGKRLSPFVIDVPKFHLYGDPQAIPPDARGPIIEFLSRLLELGPDEIKKLSSQFAKKSRSRKLVMWIDHKTEEKIRTWWVGFAKKRKIARNALFFIQDWKRSYPYGKLLGQVLHTVRDDKDPKTARVIPTGGLEAIFDDILAGKCGKRKIVRSPRHPLDVGEIITPAIHGADIYLTIDHTLQAIAEDEIKKAVEKANAEGGWAVMIDPHTGEIWALAQYPYFYPASYRQFFNDPKKLEATKAKAITDPYEPGSVFKALTIACGLSANIELERQGKAPIVSFTEKMATSPRTFPGRSKILKDTSFHKFLNLHMGMQKSSNVYMATVVMRVIDNLGMNWYRSYLQDIFGIGVKTGIELPGESPGLLPRPGKVHPNGKLEWSAPTPYSLAMGHNVLSNSMQMLRAHSILVNGGFDVHPTLVRKIVKGDKVLYDRATLPKGKRLIHEEVSKEVIKGMKYTTKRGGSAYRADIPGYSEGGKTGTTEKAIKGGYSKKNHISTFMGFAPATKPRFVLLVAIDEPEYKYIPGVGRNQMGGMCAAPAFKEIGLKSLQYLGVEPDDPENTDWKKEVEDLGQLYKTWNSK